MLIAQAEAEKIRKIGEAEASVIEAIGKAEAEKMKLKAEAYQQYGEAAKLALVLDALPEVRTGANLGGGEQGPLAGAGPSTSCSPALRLLPRCLPHWPRLMKS